MKYLGSYTADADIATKVKVGSGGGGGADIDALIEKYWDVIPPNLPQDGKTRLRYVISADAVNENFTLMFEHVTASTQTTVDWGDLSTPTVSTGSGRKTLTHAYSASGGYTATITIDTGTIKFGGGQNYSICGSRTTAGVGIVRQGMCWMVLGKSVTDISSYTFNYCTSLANITIPSGVTSIGQYAFQYCANLTNVTIPSGVTSIGTYAFQYCANLTNITIPSSVTSIGGYAFQYCSSLPNITIPSGVTSIGNIAFSYCTSLTSITIPSGVTSIESSTFADCHSLRKIRFERTTPATVSNSNAFTRINDACIISVPVGSLSAYTSATNYPSSSTYTYIEE